MRLIWQRAGSPNRGLDQVGRLACPERGAPSKPNPHPSEHELGWFIPEPLSNRLHQKSALGKPIEGGIVLTEEEVMFCHWHRHVPLEQSWVDDRLAENPNFVYKSVAYDVVRSAGEKVVPIEGDGYDGLVNHIPVRAKQRQKLDGQQSRMILILMNC